MLFLDKKVVKNILSPPEASDVNYHFLVKKQFKNIVLNLTFPKVYFYFVISWNEALSEVYLSMRVCKKGTSVF